MSAYCVVNKFTYLCFIIHTNHGGNDSRHEKNGYFKDSNQDHKNSFFLHSKTETWQSRRTRLHGRQSKHQQRRWKDTIEIFECFSVIFLNKASKPISWAHLSQGGISGTVADVKLIFTHALLAGASAIICIHNHPSGNLKPSEADRDFTKKIKESGKILDIVLLDHLILTKELKICF